jgi:high-affinity iron transporter
LFASAESGAVSSIAGGMVVGLGLLAAVYVLIQRFGMKLPLRPFFAVTSALLYFMAFSFAGQGVAELQEAGYIDVTPLGSAPAVPALGIFPTLQTLGIQLVLATAFLLALVWIFWIGPRRQSHQVVVRS